jgi:hypothetical protein
MQNCYQKEIWSHHRFCWPCKPPTGKFLWCNSWSEMSLQSRRKIPWSDIIKLSCWQWKLCRQCLHAIGSCWIWSNNILLQSQCTLSKWNHQEMHLQPLWASLQATPTCKGKMARDNWD